MAEPFLVVASSFLFFGLLRFLLWWLSHLPKAVVNSGRPDITWRWYNVWISWFHAILVGLGSLCCLFNFALRLGVYIALAGDLVFGVNMAEPFLVVASSFLFFGLLRFLLWWLSHLPKAVVNSGRPDITWRWYNVWISWFHAILVGLGSLCCLVNEPKMLFDLYHCEQPLATTLVAASVGYFFYDALDIMMYIPIGQSLAVLCHHIVVIMCFGMVLKSGFYESFAVVALLVEVNSIFLHARQLLRIAKNHQSWIYTANVFFNIVTFFVFRFVNLSWLLYWTWMNQESIDQPYLAVLVISIPIMYAINIGLFLQVLAKDVPHVLSLIKTSNVRSLNSWNRITNGQSCQNGSSMKEFSSDYRVS